MIVLLSILHRLQVKSLISPMLWFLTKYLQIYQHSGPPNLCFWWCYLLNVCVCFWPVLQNLFYSDAVGIMLALCIVSIKRIVLAA